MALPDNKKSMTISFPRDLIPPMREHIKRYGAKRQWLIWVAGFVTFCRMTERERDELIASINAADFVGGSFLKLLDRPDTSHGIVSEDHPPLKRRPSSHHQPTPRKARS